MKTLPKALLFDLGGVLIDISFGKALEHWSARSGVPKDRLASRFRFGPAYEQHERGEITAQAYFASLRQELGVALSDEEMREGWNAIFLGEIKETVELLENLQGKVPLYAFSNSNATHKAFWSRRYASALLPFDHVFVSSDIGLRKPEVEAYSYVAQAMGHALKDIMFFDDTEANIDTAASLGMQAVQVNEPDDLRRALEPLL